MGLTLPTADRILRARVRVGLGFAALLLAIGCRESTSPSSLANDGRRMRADVVPDSAPPPDSTVPRQPVLGDYIVVFKSDVADPSGLARRLVSEQGGELHFAYTSVLRGFAAHLPDRAVQALQSNPQVERIDPDLVATVTSDQPAPSWGLDRVDQRGLPLNGTYSYTNSGAGANVYVLDTGIRTTHVEFGGRASGAFTVIDDGNGTDDCVGHGTHVAGTIGGATFGVAKAAKLYAVRVLDCDGSGAWSGVIAALDWVAKNHVSPAVVNLSLGGEFVPSVNDAIANTVASGVAVVVSAGNSSGDACNFSPSSAAAAITVGSANWNDYQSTFSNYGPCVDLFAPGEGITSSANWDDSSSVMLSGTSMAAPHVTGAAALYLGANPAATPAEVASAIVSTATAGAMAKISRTSPNLLVYTGSLGPSSGSGGGTGGTGGGGSTGGSGGSSGGGSTPTSPTSSPPVATFTSNCQKGTCTFDGSGSRGTKALVTFDWDFGDGITGSGTTPMANHVYTTKGNYSVTVTLTVKDAGGLTGTVQKILNIKNNGK